ncbi:MAG TPA: formyltransferase [Chromatiales bacterium]|nr:formyltransferase [Chromatiales bacterium]
MRPRAVVFGYHDMGVLGFDKLIEHGFEIPLVVTHEDNPDETIWFASLADRAADVGVPVIRPDDPNTPELVNRLRNCRPDFLFSFYYRHMLGAELLAIPARGAYNLHGSLLPKYRGRVPVNWAVLHGETETGVSLHKMTVKPDAGDLVDQQTVPIGPNDTAGEVFARMVEAAGILLDRALPQLAAGTAKHTPLDLSQGSYFGGRRPEDGRIDWGASAQAIHNLIRAVAPPYPGAFTDVDGRRLMLLGSVYDGQKAVGPGPRLYWQQGRCYADCADGHRLEVTRLSVDGQELDAGTFEQLFGSAELAGLRQESMEADT